MFGLRVQVELQVAHVVPAVGQEGQLLICLHALGLQQLEQTPLRLLIESLDEGETLRIGRRRFLGIVALESGDALAGDGFVRAPRTSSSDLSGTPRRLAPSMTRAGIPALQHQRPFRSTVWIPVDPSQPAGSSKG
jgi:hypothetical protein